MRKKFRDGVLHEPYTLWHSYASMHCITGLSQSFYWCLLPFVYAYLKCNSRVYVTFTQVKGLVLRILYTHAYDHRRAAWVARRPAIVEPVSWWWIICTLLETLRSITQ